MVVKVKGWRQQVSYLILLFSSIWIFFCLNDSSMAIESLMLFVALFIVNLRYSNIRDTVPTSFITMFFFVSLYISGRFFERGNYNIPWKFMVKFCHMLFAVICGSVMNNLESYQKKNIIKAAFVSIFFSCIVSIYYVIFVNNLAIRLRDLAGIMQTVSFDQLYALPILFPVLFLFYFKNKNNIKNKTIFIIFSILILVCIFESVLTTAIILTVIGVILCFLMLSFEKRNRKAIFCAFVLFVIALFILLFRRQIGEIAYGLTKNMDPVIQGRLRQVFDILFATEHENSYSMDRRFELANYSLETFKSHPLFGVGIGGIEYGVIGYHQEWPDILGVCGVFGTLIIVMVFMDYIRRVQKRLVCHIDKGCFLLGLILFFILGCFDPCLQLPELYILTVILPNISVLTETEGRHT